MNADGRALFAAICADPEDDTSRLVYADWLEEQGDDARAGALRMSVERRRLPDWEPRAWVLDARMDRLCEAHQKRWDEALPKLAAVHWSTGRSGLAEHVSVNSPRALLEKEDVIFSAGPISSASVNLVLGDDAPHDAGILASCRSMSRVRSLSLDGVVSPDLLGFPVLAASPYFRGLRHLERDTCADDDDFLEYLAGCPAFPGLESLKLNRAIFETAGYRALSLSPILQTLRGLTLTQANVGDAGLRHLMRMRHFWQLRELRLSENALTARPFKSFFSMDWERLEHLDLSANSLSAAAVRHLVECPPMRHLRWLDLGASQSPHGDAGLKVLARAPHLDDLRVLSFGFNDVSDAGLDALAHADWAPNLARLELTGTHITRRDLRGLASPAFGNLRWLDLGYGHMTDEEIPHLLSLPWLPRLTHLVLSNNAIGYEGARLLASSPLDSIELLDLTSNKIAEAERELLHGRFGDRVRLANSWDR